MQCEVGSCRANATLRLAQAMIEYPDEYETDIHYTCGRHAASTLTAMVRVYGTVTVEAPESATEPRSEPRGIQGDPLVSETVRRPYHGPDDE